jgi:hypothetical protein
MEGHMQAQQLIDYLPLWGVFVATLGVVLMSVSIGYGVGRYEKGHPEDNHEPGIGAIVGATLGLLAFLLAFTFGEAAARFDVRKQLVLDDANAIGTSYLRSQLLPEPGNRKTSAGICGYSSRGHAAGEAPQREGPVGSIAPFALVSNDRLRTEASHFKCR